MQQHLQLACRGKYQVIFLVLDKISKNKKDRGRRKKTKMSKGFTVKRSCGGETSGKWEFQANPKLRQKSNNKNRQQGKQA